MSNCPLSPLFLTLRETARRLAQGTISSRALVESCLEILDSTANARAAYLLIDSEGARAAADGIDRERRAGHVRSPFAGIPISIKDLFDVAGQVTTAGSSALLGRPAAGSDAPALASLRHAGFIFMGRTHMSEFAYSGLGLNSHYDDPHCIWQPEERRVPGGSSSGAAISVAMGTAMAAIGTDTGGSCRIPAAFNRLVGFKPTAARIDRKGTFPLSSSLDSIGPIARTVECCAVLDQLLSGNADSAATVDRPRLLVPTNYVLDGAQAEIADAFNSAVNRLREGGLQIVHERLPALDWLPELQANGGLVASEAFHFHRSLLAEAAHLYDPRVLRRLRAGEGAWETRYAQQLQARVRFISQIGKELAPYDAMIAPTCPIVPPRMIDCAESESYTRNNSLVLRNPSIANQMDGCSISIPIREAAVPAGLMCIAAHGHDVRLLAIGRLIEKLMAL